MVGKILTSVGGQDVRQSRESGRTGRMSRIEVPAHGRPVSHPAAGQKGGYL